MLVIADEYKSSSKGRRNASYGAAGYMEVTASPRKWHRPNASLQRQASKHPPAGHCVCRPVSSKFPAVLNETDSDSRIKLSIVVPAAPSQEGREALRLQSSGVTMCLVRNGWVGCPLHAFTVAQVTKFLGHEPEASTWSIS